MLAYSILKSERSPLPGYPREAAAGKEMTVPHSGIVPYLRKINIFLSASAGRGGI
jgi:hypothetical protein